MENFQSAGRLARSLGVRLLVPGVVLTLALACGGAKSSTTPPTISAFVPAVGVTGTPVVVSGADFTGATAVTIGGVSVPNGTVTSDTQLTLVVPANAVTGAIVVTTPAGNVTSAMAFTVVPQITGISPVSGPKGTIVTLTGSGFTGATRLVIGNEVLGGSGSLFSVSSANQIIATVAVDASTGPLWLTASGVTSSQGPTFTVTN